MCITLWHTTMRGCWSFRGTRMSGPSLNQAHGNGKGFPRSDYGCWQMIGLHIKTVHEKVSMPSSLLRMTPWSCLSRLLPLTNFLLRIGNQPPRHIELMYQVFRLLVNFHLSTWTNLSHIQVAHAPLCLLLVQDFAAHCIFLLLYLTLKIFSHILSPHMNTYIYTYKYIMQLIHYEYNTNHTYMYKSHNKLHKLKIVKS